MLPTAEAAITSLHRDEILSADDLPLYYVAHTPCWRREKASAGRDTRGIMRVHQFDKVEMFKFVEPESSSEELGVADGCRRRCSQSTGDPVSAPRTSHRRLGIPGGQGIRR